MPHDKHLKIVAPINPDPIGLPDVFQPGAAGPEVDLVRAGHPAFNDAVRTCADTLGTTRFRALPAVLDAELPRELWTTNLVLTSVGVPLGMILRGCQRVSTADELGQYLIEAAALAGGSPNLSVLPLFVAKTVLPDLTHPFLSKARVVSTVQSAMNGVLELAVIHMGATYATLTGEDPHALAWIHMEAYVEPDAVEAYIGRHPGVFGVTS